MRLRKFLCCGILVGAVGLQAQWQLPPGTSSSTVAAQNASAAASTDDVARAEKLLEAQDWAAAAKLLRPVVARDPNNAHAQYDLGFALDNAGDTPAAAEAYRAAAQDDPALVSARASLGLLLARTGDTAGAEKWLSEAIALPENASSNPARAQAYRALARLHLQSAPDRARDELLAAIKLDGERPGDVELSGSIAEALHDPVGSADAYRRALLATPNDPELTAALVRVLVQQGKQDEASTALQSALAAHPGNRALLTEEANLLLSANQFEQAVPLLEQLHAADPDNAALGRLLARAYVASGDPAKADPLFLAAVRADPGDPLLLTDYADSLIRQKRNPEAEQVLERALKLPFPTPADRAQAASRLAFAASVDHHPAVVIRAVTLRDSISPPDAATTFLLATAHDTLHDTAQAAEEYRKFIELAGQSFPDEVWQAQQRLQVLRRAK